MIRYVVGFLFSNPEDQYGDRRVALIRKAKPEWQKGRFNGIGGKIEEGESPAEAMAREFREETGVDDSIPWEEYASLQDGRGWVIYFFRAHAPYELLKRAEQNSTDFAEPVSLHCVGAWGRGLWERVEARHPGGFARADEAIFNLNWLIPLALDRDIHGADVHERHKDRSGAA